MMVQCLLLVLTIAFYTTEVAAGSNQRKCFDHHKACPLWSKDGECKQNPGFMLTHCKFSCGKCDVPCFDTSENCSMWALEGKCNDNSSVSAYCPKACNSCGKDTFYSIKDDCVDQHDGCKDFGKRGECQANPRWMLSNCAGTCSSCVKDLN